MPESFSKIPRGRSSRVPSRDLLQLISKKASHLPPFTVIRMSSMIPLLYMTGNVTNSLSGFLVIIVYVT
jgi:hypothetical protein